MVSETFSSISTRQLAAEKQYTNLRVFRLATKVEIPAHRAAPYLGIGD